MTSGPIHERIAARIRRLRDDLDTERVLRAPLTRDEQRELIRAAYDDIVQMGTAEMARLAIEGVAIDAGLVP